MNPFISRILPFFYLGIVVVLFIVGLILLSYLLISGAIVGLILFVIAWIVDFFKKKRSHTIQKKSKKGHTIDHDDL